MILKAVQFALALALIGTQFFRADSAFAANTFWNFSYTNPESTGTVSGIFAVNDLNTIISVQASNSGVFGNLTTNFVSPWEPGSGPSGRTPHDNVITTGTFPYFNDLAFSPESGTVFRMTDSDFNDYYFWLGYNSNPTTPGENPGFFYGTDAGSAGLLSSGGTFNLTQLPEIDGATLPKAALLLFSLYVIAQSRRRQSHDTTAPDANAL